MNRHEITFLLSLAWKNLSRYRKRTVITSITIAAGIAIFIFMDSWLLGADKESFRNLIWYETGSATIVTPTYWEEKDTFPLKFTVDNPEAIIASVEQAGYRASPRVRFAGEMIVYEDPYPADGSLQARFIAIDPEREKSVFRLHEEVSEGRYLEPGENGLMLGAWLADTLGAQVGYPVTVVTRTKDGGRTTMDLEVVGILETPNPVVNRSSAYVGLDFADANLSMEGTVTEIDVSFPETEQVPIAMAKIDAAIKAAGASGLTARSWEETGADYVQLAATKSKGSGIMLFLVFIIAAVGISNTMLMAVYERIREIGMMRAMGMRDREIRITFMFEAAGIGLLGSTAGLILGTVMAWFIITIGVDFSFITRDFDIGYRIASVSHGAWHPAGMIFAFVLGIVMSMAVAWIPSKRAIKKSITECLRYQ